ncbi:MAG: hypothetical protein KDC88_12330 [Ignavibacteriae bacterium]|nr:hypothetical protein [Ignavibacteriota bacterium]
MEILSNSLRIQFSKANSIDGLFILPKSTKVCADGLHKIIIRTHNAVSDPVVLEKIKYEAHNDEKTELFFESDEKEYSAVIRYSKKNDGIGVHLKANSPKPIWLVELELSGFSFNEVLIPALGGQSISRNMPEGKMLSYKYPFWWNSQFFIGKVDDGGVIISSEDPSNNLKMLRVSKQNGKFSFTYGMEAEAPLVSNELEGEYIIQGFSGDWKDGVDIHKRWMSKHFELSAFDSHPHYPKWMNNINFVLELWGARKGLKAFHTFDQMIERIEDWTKLHNPQETLLYLPGYAQNGVDSNAPNYDPSHQCGGDIKFKKLIDRAHVLGYKVMIHTNILAMTFGHPKYKEFEKYSVYDPWGRQVTWGLDLDGDWLPEPYFAYMNPGYTEWGDFMSEVLGTLIKKFNLDAVFLDQTLLAFNNSKGPNFIKGMHDHIKRLQENNPNILFAGEGINERVLPRLPVVQIHGIDSITDVHGMDDRVNWRKLHPISSYLFGDYARFSAHLLTKHTSDPIFELQEKAYSELNVIPALSLYEYEQEMDTPATRRMIERAKKISIVK